MNKVIFLLLPLALAGCGLFGIGGGDKDNSKVESGPSDAIFDTREGPNTKRLVKDSDIGLVGDKANARHTNEDLRGDDSIEEDSGGND